ncbi:Metallo-hydrolase/oxidoreductase, partial [Auricularia subglabra TFB-10046 SS5]
IKATWLGHAGYLVQLDKDTAVVFDPIFSERAGPAAAQGAYAVGPARFAPAPCKVDELPDNVRFVVISHNHYDHLDLATILGIHAKQGNRVTYLVPLGNKAWFTSCGIPEDQVHELDWWESFEPPVAISEHGAGAAPLSKTLKFTCVPAQHSSGRGLTDQRATLWCGWGRRLASVYHAGDTGYATPRGPAPFFAEIGARFGPLDLALVPLVHAPNTHSPLSQLHASPAEARAIARDVRARHALAMHFGTFVGSALEAREPLVELA